GGSDAVPAEVIDEYVEAHHRFVGQDDARGGAAHEQALALVRHALQTGRAFGLVLRNFDLEAYVGVGSDAEVLALGGQGPTTAERRLMTSVAPWLPLVGISNPTQLLHHDLAPAAEIMPRLEVADDAWLECVAGLVD